MDVQQYELTKLIECYVNGTLTEAEQYRLTVLAGQDAQVRQLLEAFQTPDVLTSGLERLDEYQQRANWDKVLEKQQRRCRNKRFALGIRTAAAIGAFLLLGWWLIDHSTEPGVIADTKYGHRNDVLPGESKAILTLADGSTLTLGGLSDVQETEAGVTLNIKDGALTYASTELKASEPVYHQLDVPVGGVYELTLVDGTRVWVNSEASLRFPILFPADERRVSIEGEAFFEVAQDERRPFVVDVKGLEIRALGTAFNVNSHRKDGSVKTILTEGKIRVSNGSRSEELLPGTAVVVSGEDMEVSIVDPEEALAWKDGYFYFNQKTINEILDELARWYGIEVSVTKPLTDKRYIGGIKRSSTLAAVCALLSEMSGRQFSIKGKRLTVH